MLVTSSFTGDELVLFGSIERDAATVAAHGRYDIVVTVTGPRETLVTRRKDRVVGIWINVESRSFLNVPTYLARAEQPAGQRRSHRPNCCGGWRSA